MFRLSGCLKWLLLGLSLLAPLMVWANPSEIRYELAPQDRVLLLEAIDEVVRSMAGHPEAALSDESYLSDLWSYDSDHAIRPVAGRPGYYVFKVIYVTRDPQNLRRVSKKEVEVEVRAFPRKRIVIRRILRRTGVDITPVIDQPYPDLLQYIADNMTANYRRQILGSRACGPLMIVK